MRMGSESYPFRERKGIMKETRKTLSEIGWKYSIFGVEFIAVQLGLSMLFAIFFKDWLNNNSVLFSLLTVVMAVDLIGFPLVYLLTINMEKRKLEKHNLSFWQYFLGIFIMAGLVLIGTLIGLPIHMILTLPFGVDLQDSGIAGMMMNSSIWLRILVVGIGAPVFEELIFRKVLIDHVSPKGELLAILLSGFAFGLFHGNFQQGFFAMFIGMFFALVYVRTGKIIYTISYHMLLNMTTSIVTTTLLIKFTAVDEQYDLTNKLSSMGDSEMIQFIMSLPGKDLIPFLAYYGWSLFLFAFAGLGVVALLVVIIVCVIVKKDKLIRPIEGEISKGQQVGAMFSSWGLWIFYLVTFSLFVINYASPIITFIAEKIPK